MSEPFYISRSALLTYQTCNRKYFYSNEFNNHGISSKFINRDLLIGSAIHRGLQHLFEHCRLNHPSGDFDETCVDEAVKVALELFDKETSNPSCQIGIRKTEDLGYVLIESRNLVEALIRTYSLVRLPLFLEEYEILEIEKEDVLNFEEPKVCSNCSGTGKVTNYSSQNLTIDEFKCIGCDGVGKFGGIIFLAKADGLLRRKSDNKLVVLSIKTISEFVDEGSSKTPTIQSISIDMQGNSEAYVIKTRLNNIYKQYYSLITNEDGYGVQRLLAASNTNPEIATYFYSRLQNDRIFKDINVNLVQYEHLVKGEMAETPYGSGIYKRNSILLHPYHFDNGAEFDLRSGAIDKNQFAITFGRGKPPKGWSKIDIWKKMSIKDWIWMLATGEIQPELGQILHKFIRASDVIFRSDEEQMEWYWSTKKLVQEIKSKSKNLTTEHVAIDYDQRLWMLYPKDTQQCLKYYGQVCTYYSLCHQGIDAQEALNDNLYQIRKPHHDLEAKKFEEKGLL